MLIMLIIVKYINYFIRNVFTKLIFYILMAEFVNRFLNMKNIKKKNLWKESIYCNILPDTYSKSSFKEILRELFTRIKHFSS